MRIAGNAEAQATTVKPNAASVRFSMAERCRCTVAGAHAERHSIDADLHGLERPSIRAGGAAGGHAHGRGAYARAEPVDGHAPPGGAAPKPGRARAGAARARICVDAAR